MRLLLDTNAIIWWDSKSSKLSKKAQVALRDTSNEVFISVVSTWEMQIKAQIGKLKQHKPWQEIVREQIQVNEFPLLRPEQNQIFLGVERFSFRILECFFGISRREA